MSTTDAKGFIAARFLDSLLSEIVLDTALDAHATVKKARSICKSCGTKCQSHTPAAVQASVIDPANDLEEGERPPEPSQTGTPTPSQPGNGGSAKPDYYSHNPLFECLVCSRQVSSNRYATHLAKCMGMGGKGARKGATRNAKATVSTPLSSRLNSISAGTPRGSDDDSVWKNRKKVTPSTTAKGKRALSPPSASHVASLHINKKIKTSSPTPPPSSGPGGSSGNDIGAGATGMGRSHSAQTFAPSGLSQQVVNGSPLNPSNDNNGGGKKGSSSTMARASVERGASEIGTAASGMASAARRGSSSSPTKAHISGGNAVHGSSAARARDRPPNSASPDKNGGSPLKRQRYDGAMDVDDDNESGYEDRVSNNDDDSDVSDDDDDESDDDADDDDDDDDDEEDEDEDDDDDDGEEGEISGDDVAPAAGVKAMSKSLGSHASSTTAGKATSGRLPLKGSRNPLAKTTYASRPQKAKGGSMRMSGLTSDSDQGVSSSGDGDSREPGAGGNRTSPDVPLGKSFGSKTKGGKSSGGGPGLQREKGSDGVSIGVESASEQSDMDMF